MRLLLFFFPSPNNQHVGIMQEIIYCRSGDLYVAVLKAVPVLQISCLIVYSIANIDSKSSSICWSHVLLILNTTKQTLNSKLLFLFSSDEHTPVEDEEAKSKSSSSDSSSEGTLFCVHNLFQKWEATEVSNPLLLLAGGSLTLIGGSECGRLHLKGERVFGKCI